MKKKTVFELIAIMPNEHSTVEEVGKYDIDRFGNILSHEEFIGIYENVNTAEKMIKALIRKNVHANETWGSWVQYFCFILTERQLNPKIDKHWNVPEFESVRSYLADGTLNCVSDYDSSCKKKFNGREIPTRVKDGDFAYYCMKDKIVPILMEKVSYTKDEWKKHFKPGVKGDFTDDSGYAYIIGYGHDHPFSPYVFPLTNLAYRANLDDKIKKMLLKEQHKND